MKSVGQKGVTLMERNDAPRPFHPMHRKKKVCAFCTEKVEVIDYKDTLRLKKYISERAKILPRRVTGLSAKMHRKVTREIKRARSINLLP